LFEEIGSALSGKGYVSGSHERGGEIIPYPTLYYTASYADEWAPNGETEWNGYTIQQISQEELDAILAEARGEEPSAASATPAPTALQTEGQQIETPTPEKTEEDAAPATSIETILLAAIGISAIAVTVVLIVRGRKAKR
jgi:hypothetical protein